MDKKEFRVVKFKRSVRCADYLFYSENKNR